MKKLKSIFFSLILLSSCAYCQHVPTWVHKLPTPSNNTYMYVREKAEGFTENQARNQAIAQVFQSTAMRLGQPISSDEIFKAVQNGTEYSVLSATYNIPINKVCEYSQQLKNGQYRVYVLCQVAVKGNITPYFDDVSFCNNTSQYNNTIALVESVFVPGLGQMGKRHYVEGITTLVSELAMVSGALGCYFIAQDKLSIMKSSDVSYDDFMSAKDIYNTMRTTNYILWGASAVLYAFNLYRAFTLEPIYKDLVFSPMVMPTTNNDLCLGLAFSMKF